jgi:hypothetical protein
MARARQKTRSAVAAHPIASTVIAILLAADIFFVLFTPIYSRITPKIGDWPFFYWYLLIFMPITSLVLWIVVQLQKPFDRMARERAAAHEEGEVRS